MSRARELEPNYRIRHTLYLGAELELYVEQYSGHSGYWLGVRETDGSDVAELCGYRAESLEQLRGAARALEAVVARLEREERL